VRGIELSLRMYVCPGPLRDGTPSPSSYLWSIFPSPEIMVMILATQAHASFRKNAQCRQVNSGLAGFELRTLHPAVVSWGRINDQPSTRRRFFDRPCPKLTLSRYLTHLSSGQFVLLKLGFG
jgi:hypothetical protein